MSASSETPSGALEADVVVIGGGPAGSAVARLLSAREGVSVVLVDPRAGVPWPANYGVWTEEWDSLAKQLDLPLRECIDHEWQRTDCYFGGSWDVPNDERLSIDRAYIRVGRNALKALLRDESAAARSGKGGSLVVLDGPGAKVSARATASPNVFQGTNGASRQLPPLVHDADGSTLVLDDGRVLRCKLVIDASGSESPLTVRQPPAGVGAGPPEGYQIAWGFEAIVDQHAPYAKEAMTLFDYRTDHLDAADPSGAWSSRAGREPTFMYAMPLGDAPGGGPNQRIFFEETSLVARPAISFEECRQRTIARLEHHGIRVLDILEEELCYIPMGGALPLPGQRVIAVGGAAALVHPATGYQLCRGLSSADAVAKVVGAAMRDAGKGRALNPAATAAAAYHALWSPSMQAQRDFSVFGGDFLMAADVTLLRGWFGGFFQLEERLWAGYLAGYSGLPNNDQHESWAKRLSFGLQLLVRIPPAIALKLAIAIAAYTIRYGLPLVRSVTPFFGEPASYLSPMAPPQNMVGDEVAKSEAREFKQGYQAYLEQLESRSAAKVPETMSERERASSRR